MPKVTVEVELTEEHYRSIVSESERRRVSIESLVQQMTQELVRELELEERLVGEGRQVDTPTSEQRSVFRDAAADVIDRAMEAIDHNLLALLPGS